LDLFRRSADYVIDPARMNPPTFRSNNPPSSSGREYEKTAKGSAWRFRNSSWCELTSDRIAIFAAVHEPAAEHKAELSDVRSQVAISGKADVTREMDAIDQSDHWLRWTLPSPDHKLPEISVGQDSSMPKRGRPKAAAILAADVRRLQQPHGHDEEGTLAALKRTGKELIDPR